MGNANTIIMRDFWWWLNVKRTQCTEFRQTNFDFRMFCNKSLMNFLHWKKKVTNLFSFFLSIHKQGNKVFRKRRLSALFVVFIKDSFYLIVEFFFCSLMLFLLDRQKKFDSEEKQALPSLTVDLLAVFAALSSRLFLWLGLLLKFCCYCFPVEVQDVSFLLIISFFIWN